MLLSTTLLGLLLKGGWLMLPLGCLSLISVYIMIERWITYRAHLNYTNRFIQELEKLLHNGNLTDAYQLCLPQDNVLQQVLCIGLNQRQISSKSLELILEGESQKRISFLEQKLSFLATVSGVAPMIGFLGTVTGMMKTFMAIAQEHNHIALLSNGIYEAMVTTVAGLFVGITAYLGYNYYVARVNHAAQSLTYLGNLLLAKVK